LQSIFKAKFSLLSIDRKREKRRERERERERREEKGDAER
jgi:hypothetical protein